MWTTISWIVGGMFLLSLGLSGLYDKPKWLWDLSWKISRLLRRVLRVPRKSDVLFPSWSWGIVLLMLGTGIITSHFSNYATSYQSYGQWFQQSCSVVVGLFLICFTSYILLYEEEEDSPRDQEPGIRWVPCALLILGSCLLSRNVLCWWHGLIILFAIMILLIPLKEEVKIQWRERNEWD